MRRSEGCAPLVAQLQQAIGLEQRLRHVAEKPRRWIGPELTEKRSRLRQRKEQPPARSRKADVAEPPLFGHLLFVRIGRQRARVRKHSLLETCNEHRVEFQ